MRKTVLLAALLLSLYLPAFAQPTITCTHTVSGSSGNITIGNGEVYCIENNYTVNALTIDAGGTLLIKEGAVVDFGWKSNINGTIINKGSVTLNAQNSSVRIENYGSMTGTFQGQKGNIVNHEDALIQLTGYSSFNGSKIVNNGHFKRTSGGTELSSSSVIENSGAFELINTDNFTVNSLGSIENSGTMTIHSFQFEGVKIDNSGTFTVNNGFQFKAGLFNNTHEVAINTTKGTSTFTGKLENTGNFSIYKLSSISAEIINYGSLRIYDAANNISNKTSINNDGTLDFINISEVQYNGAIMVNNGRVTTSGKLKLNNSSADIVNNGIIVTNGNFEFNAPNAKLTNNCRVVVTGDFLVHGGNVENNGLIWTLKSFVVNGNGIVKNQSLGFVRGKDFTNSGFITGLGSFYFTGTTNNNGGSIKGDSVNLPILFFDQSQTGNSIVDMGNAPVNTIRPAEMLPLDSSSYECSAPPTVAGNPPRVKDIVINVTKSNGTVPPLEILLRDSIAPYDENHTLDYNTLRLFSVEGNENTLNLSIPGSGIFEADPNSEEIVFIPNASLGDGTVVIEYRIGNFRNGDPLIYLSERRTITINIINPLPVKLASFEAKQEGQSVILKWTTFSEKNAMHFEIEKSANGRVFQPLNEKVPAAGESATLRNYTFTDQHPFEGTNYYRLKTYDRDGKVEYSEVKSLYFRGAYSEVNLYPNPVSDRVNIASLKDDIQKVLIVSSNGAVIFEGTGLNSKNVAIDLSAWAPGHYFAIVTLKNGIGKTFKLIKTY